MPFADFGEHIMNNANNALTILQRPSTFRFSATTLLVAAVAALVLLLAASRADAQEGRPLRDEGIRYLKLAGTYREARDYDMALRYAIKGLQMVNSYGSPYWEAAGYETIGLIYRDMGDKRTALEYLQRASTMYSTIIRQKDGSQVAVNSLIDDLQQSPDVNMNALQSEYQRNQEINRQLNDRMSRLDSRIRQLEPPASRGGASVPMVNGNTINTDKPQGEYAPYGPDKKPLPAVPARVARDTAKTPTLPVLVLQLGAGVGFGLNTAGISPVSTFSSTSATSPLNPASTLSGILLTLSADYFITQNFSIGLIGGYNFSVLNPTSANGFRYDSLRTTVRSSTGGDSEVVSRIDTSAQTRTGIGRYQFVGLRLAYHLVRTPSFDFYAGLSGGVVWPSSALQWQAGVLLGVQYNFTPLLGVFVDGVVGAANNDTYRLNGTSSGSALGLGGYGRLGLSFSF
jgi:tetratricopeptide (TPR) repeat protein